MASQVFESEPVRSAMRAFLAACDAVEAATMDSDLLDLSDAKVLAGLNLRKALVGAGWTAPARSPATS
jgi:hypothetical protein